VFLYKIKKYLYIGVDFYDYDQAELKKTHTSKIDESDLCNDTYYYYTIRWFVVVIRRLSGTLFMVIPNARFKRFRRRHISTGHAHMYYAHTYINRMICVPLDRRCRERGTRRFGTKTEIPFGRTRRGLHGACARGIVRRPDEKHVNRIVILYTSNIIYYYYYNTYYYYV